MRSDLPQLIVAVRQLSRHVAALKAQQPRLVKIHSAPPRDAAERLIKRSRGRPRGSRTRILHVNARSDDEARALAASTIERQ